MKVKVAKWGNSLAVRLPKAALESAGVTAGSELDLIVWNGTLTLRPIRKTSAQRLADLIAEMKRLGPEREPETLDWGPDRGSEIIDDVYSRGEITLEDILARPGSDEPVAKHKTRQRHAREKRR
jgi:antitoxin MazE